MDPTLFRELMAGVSGPVTVVTAVLDGVPHGTTVSAMMSVSMRPPLVGVGLDAASQILAHARASGRFGINVLAHDQSHVALRFAQKAPPAQKFEGVDWALEDGLPRIGGALGWMVCSVEQAIEAGDHVILLGRLASGVSTKGAPLVYAQRSFGTHTALVPQVLSDSPARSGESSKEEIES